MSAIISIIRLALTACISTSEARYRRALRGWYSARATNMTSLSSDTSSHHASRLKATKNQKRNRRGPDSNGRSRKNKISSLAH